MSYKYTLKDVLLEAGVKEYYSIPEDKSWQRSEKHTKAMNKLFDKQLPLYKHIGSSPLYKGITIAAAAALIFGAAMAIKPIREPVTAFLGSIFGKTKITDTDENTYITEPDETDPAVITDTEKTEPAVITDTETTEPEETEDHTETEQSETEPDFDGWDKLDTQGRVERAVYEITHYGINYQRFRYLCGDEHADDIYDDGGYYLGDESADNFTYGYFLDLYDTETDPLRKQLMFVYISSFLTDTWNDETRTVPYTTKYYPYFDRFKADSLPRLDLSYNEECDKWIHEHYYNAFCNYARYMTEEDVKTKYLPSYKLIKKYGFDDFLTSKRTQKANFVINEFFNMALSVKYGIAVSDPSSNIYCRFDEGDGYARIYEPGDAVYTALLKYYTKDELDHSDSAPVVYEQREGIKTVDEWKEYFNSLTTKSIADDFVKENRCFLVAEDGRVLTSEQYRFFNTNNLQTPFFGELSDSVVSDDNGVITAIVFINDVDQERDYTVELKEEKGELKITGGTLVTEWLNRTLSSEECEIRDTIIDAEKLFHLMRFGLVSDFRYYGCDTAYSIEYNNNPPLPEGL